MKRAPDQSDTSHSDVRDFYEATYYATVPDVEPLAWHLRKVASRLGSMQGAQVLDIACGTGEWLVELAGRGAAVAGIDISPKAVSIVRERLPGAEIHEGIAEELPFEDGRFDVVTCMGSLEHFLDQAGALREMQRVAKPGATFLILVPNAGFLTRRLGLYKGTGQTAIRETVRTLEEWSSLIGDSGLRVVALWRDLHTLSMSWIKRGAKPMWPVRALQAFALALWPVAWQYQVYFVCKKGGHRDS